MQPALAKQLEKIILKLDKQLVGAEFKVAEIKAHIEALRQLPKN